MKTALRQVDGEPFFRVIIIGQSGRRVIDNCAHNEERCCGSSVKDRASSSLRKANVMGERDRNDAWEAAERERLAKELVETVVRMGYPEEFGHAIVQNLRTEKTMRSTTTASITRCCILAWVWTRKSDRRPEKEKSNRSDAMDWFLIRSII